MPQQKKNEQPEDGIDIPYEQLEPETLGRMIQEFVTRDGADWAESGCSLEEKVAQVYQQLQNRQVKVVYDLRSETANLVACC